MTEVERFQHLRYEKGWRCDIAGRIYCSHGTVVNLSERCGRNRFTYRIGHKILHSYSDRFVFWFFREWLPKEVIHANGDKSDDRFVNLRHK